MLPNAVDAEHTRSRMRNEDNFQLCASHLSRKAAGTYPERSEGWRGRCALVWQRPIVQISVYKV